MKAHLVNAVAGAYAERVPLVVLSGAPAAHEARSGLLLLTERDGVVRVKCERRATPNKQALRIKPESVMDIARLANLRMWDAYEAVRRAQSDVEHWRQRAKEQTP